MGLLGFVATCCQAVEWAELVVVRWRVIPFNEGRGVGILPANYTTCSASIADLTAHFDRLEAYPTFLNCLSQRVTLNSVVS
jgi:hypothetical protein